MMTTKEDKISDDFLAVFGDSKLPVDVTVNGVVTIAAGCKLRTLLKCIKNHEQYVETKQPENPMLLTPNPFEKVV